MAEVLWHWIEVLINLIKPVVEIAPPAIDLFTKIARVMLIALPILAGIGIALGVSIGSGSILPIAITLGVIGLAALVTFVVSKIQAARAN
jgi:hypothetical protein